MRKILSKSKTNLSKEDKEKFSSILKNRLRNIKEVSLVSRKVVETYTYKTDEAKFDLIDLKRKNGFVLIFEDKNTLVFEK